MASNAAAARWLTVLVAAVAAAGTGCVVWALHHVSFSDPLAFPLVMTLLVAAASTGTVVMRSRSQHLLSTNTPAVLAAVVVLPAEWALLSVGLGFAVAKAIRRQPPHKAIFNSGKEVLATAAAAAAAHAVGMVPASVTDQPVSVQWGSYLLGLGAAAVAYAVVDELLPPMAIGLATGTPWRQVARRDRDIRTATRGVDLLLAAAAVALAVVDLRLLVLVPAALLVAYLVYGYRLRLREERRAWQQLSAVTDALSAASRSGDLSHVLRTALAGAVGLFPTTEAEAEIETAGWLVRGTRRGVAYDGPAAKAPPAAAPAGEVTLATPNGEPIGTLRLRFRSGPAHLADREPDLLSTLAPHLATAIGNTTAYAEAVQLAARNAHDATHDSLTDLPNRRHLHQHLADLLADPSNQCVAVMLIDLDGFKDINDTLGHPAGDRVLAEAAQRLRTAVPDVLAARLGGDEFAVVLSEATPTVATVHAEQILAGLHRTTMDLDGVPVTLDASAGLALTSNNIGADELLRRADIALYQAKGLNQPVRLAVYQRIQAYSGTLLPPRAQVPRIDRWTLRYQPIADLATGMVVAAEAIPARPCQTRKPDHPDHDLDPLPPARLLGLLTRSGPTALHRFVDRMLDEALQAAVHWHSAGLALTVAVNLTPRSIAQLGFPALVQAKLDSHNLSPDSLTIELAHTSGHSAAFDRNLTTLRENGVRIALDGFGSTTLAAIYRIPIDSIKIDPGFITDLDSHKATAVISSIVELGRRFGLEVTAEGIEQHSQRRTLWEIGCNNGQGRLISNPMASADLVTTVQRGFDDQPGSLCPPLHADATVIRMARHG